MKRSEMLQIMVNELLPLVYTIDTRCILAERIDKTYRELREFSELLLDSMEESGMLPPIWAGMCQDHYISAQKELFKVFTWEGEDE